MAAKIEELLSIESKTKNTIKRARGKKVSLFPTVAATKTEERLLSVFLAVLRAVPKFQEAIFKPLGQRIGTLTKLDAITEARFYDDQENESRPDALLILDKSKSKWTALIEAKTKNKPIEPTQLRRYIQVAQDRGIDAVITISNEFAARPDHLPVELSNSETKGVEAYHLSWSYIRTQLDVLVAFDMVDNEEQMIMLRDLRDFMSDRRNGVSDFNRMCKTWPDVVDKLRSRDSLRKSDPDVREVVECWFQEERDLSLKLSALVGRTVEAKMSRKHTKNASDRLEDTVADFANTSKLTSTFSIPDAAADVDVCADVRGRTTMVSMTLRAPDDEDKTSDRVKWLMKMLDKPIDEHRIDTESVYVRAHYRGRAASTQAKLETLLDDPEKLDNENPDTAPHSLEIMMMTSDANRFRGTENFISDLEAMTQDFYGDIGQHLTAWQPPAPKAREDYHAARDET